MVETGIASIPNGPGALDGTRLPSVAGSEIPPRPLLTQTAGPIEQDTSVPNRPVCPVHGVRLL